MAKVNMANVDSSIKDRAVLVKLQDRAWRGGVIDTEVSRAVEKNAGAKGNTGHYWKRLVPRAALKDRLSVGNAARAFHIQHSLPWMDGGVRVLPISMFDEYMEGMRKLIQQAEAEEKKLVKAYPGWIEEARRIMGKLFKADEFPSAETIKKRFSLTVDVLPVPNIMDWRVDLSAEKAEELKKQATETLAGIQREGLLELYQTLLDALEHAKDRLSDPEAIFRDSLIKNLLDAADRVGKLNLTGDAELEGVRKQVKELLKDVTAGALRDDKEVRAKVAKETGKIMSKMASYMRAA